MIAVSGRRSHFTQIRIPPRATASASKICQPCCSQKDGTNSARGGRNERDVLKRADFARFLGEDRCRYATDDGSLGRRGFVTDILLSALDGGARYRRVYACGPLPMFRALARLLAEREVEGSFALESEMACGFGVCLGCVTPTADGRFATICKEGPCVPPTFVDWSRM